MSVADDTGPERGGDDEMIAAEYVIGVLPAGQRADAARRIDVDSAFAQLVDRWEVWFAPIAASYRPVEPPASVKPAIDRRLFASERSSPAGRLERGLWGSLGFWRALAAVALAALALYVAVPLINPVRGPLPQMVASLEADGTDVRYLALYDPGTKDVSLSHVSGERGDRDFELWLVEGQNAPVSLGVIPAGETVRVHVAPATAARLTRGIALAISLEPRGGSPTGTPTAVVAAGGLHDI